MENITHWIFVVLGFVAGYMSAVPVLNAIFFGIPFTNKLYKRGVVTEKKAILKRYAFHISVWGLFLLAAIVLLYFLLSQQTYFMFLFGLGLSVLFSLTRLGMNDFNIKSFVNTNRRYISAKKNGEYRDGLSYTIAQYLKGK
ncbi:hypothetical protein [Acetivibrio sp. MSJd-27]|uniref:hypothetical protein n=1 Tax=Acetivibrio sp. MSJd-27 TaxID=2841523 RepID=UPI0015ADF6C1|nr:hypothetical protein [Acetivibrio sp. MSJd-27]MBU5449329.1 hypothetical protein [Acetivibrio sp. MSJd-27]